MFGTRLISSIILTAITVTLGIIGGLPLLLAVGIISIIGMFELYRVLGMEKTGLAIMCYGLAAVYEVMIYTSGVSLIPAFAFGSLLAVLVLYVLTFPSYKAEQIIGAFFGLWYVTFTLSFLFIVRELDASLFWLIFISAWGNDTMAYCTGLLLGKHKLAPVLSPKKSVEGFIGGILGAGILGAVYGLIFRAEGSMVTPLSCGIICAVAGGLSVVGDLAASAIKRNYGIKDYSNLIPGHGGILDRFDSITVTAPLVFFLLMLLSAIM